MKNVILIITVLLLVAGNARGQKYFEYPRVDNLMHPFLKANTNNDGTRNAYVLGAVQASPQVLLEDRYSTLYAIMDTVATPLSILNYNDMLANEGCYILWKPQLFNLGDMMEWEKADELWPYDAFNAKIVRHDCKYSDNYHIISFEQTPDAYVMVMIQGYLYNYINWYENSTLIQQVVEKPIPPRRDVPFCNQLAFYKTLVAVNGQNLLCKDNYKAISADCGDDVLLSQNDMYMFDSLAVAPQLLLQNRYGTIYAVMDTTVTPLCDLDYNCMLDNRDCHIVWTPGTFDPNELLGANSPEAVYEAHNTDYKIDSCNYMYSDRYKAVRFKKAPKGYVMVLVQGQLYNAMTYDNYVDGPIKRPEPFCNRLAYYKTIVPFW